MRGPFRPSHHLCRCRRRWRARVAGGLAASAVLLAPGAGASSQDSAADSSLSAIVARALESPELPIMAAGLIDSIGGRLSGTPAGIRAEAWAARWLRSFGFDSVYYEVVEMPVWRRGETRVEVTAPAALRRRRIVAASYGYAPGITADSVPLLDIGRGATGAIEAAGRGARGAALLTDVVSAEVVELAAKAGAAAVLRISFQPGRLPQTRVAPWPEPPAPLPILSLSHEDGEWLRRQARAGPVALRLRVEAETRVGAAANVVGEWRGRESGREGEFLLLGAHLDAWDLGDGALDNGTGVLTVMAAAGALGAAGARPRRTVRVVLFAGEELGLLGSREYVRAHAAELPRSVAMMNLDMVGAAQGYGATGHAEADTLFARLAAEPRLKALGLSVEVDHGGGPGSDHQPFLMAGVPTIYVRSALSPDAPRWYHNAADTMDKIDLDAVKTSAAAAAAAVWALADAPARPLRHLSEEETRQLIRRLGWVN